MRLIDDSSECDFLDNLNQKYQLLSTSGDITASKRITCCDLRINEYTVNAPSGLAKWLCCDAGHR